MNKPFLQLLFSYIFINTLLFAQNATPKANWYSKSANMHVLHYTAKDSALVENVVSFLDNGIKTVVAYFDKPFVRNFDVYVFPSRQSLDEQWGKDWSIQDFKSECWMVASGVAHRLDLLSPSAWKTEACEHSAENIDHVQKLITHELVHVYHGQHNPIPDFTGMDDLGWLVEGIAVLVSGQMDSNRNKDLIEAKKQNKLPAQLKNAWSGKYRYTVCGSIVDFIVTKYSNKIVPQLLKCTKEEELMKLLNSNEGELLNNWTSSIISQ